MRAGSDLLVDVSVTAGSEHGADVVPRRALGAEGSHGGGVGLLETDAGRLEVAKDQDQLLGLGMGLLLRHVLHPALRHDRHGTRPEEQMVGTLVLRDFGGCRGVRCRGSLHRYRTRKRDCHSIPI